MSIQRREAGGSEEQEDLKHTQSAYRKPCVKGRCLFTNNILDDAS